MRKTELLILGDDARRMARHINFLVASDTKNNVSTKVKIIYTQIEDHLFDNAVNLIKSIPNPMIRESLTELHDLFYEKSISFHFKSFMDNLKFSDNDSQIPSLLNQLQYILTMKPIGEYEKNLHSKAIPKRIKNYEKILKENSPNVSDSNSIKTLTSNDGKRIVLTTCSCPTCGSRAKIFLKN